MKHGLAAGALLTICLSASSSSWAETEYFVVLGSYNDLEHAEEAKSRAALHLPEAYSVVPADTAGGFFYRVLAGPYFEKDRANGKIDEARELGFSESWLLAAEASGGGLYLAADGSYAFPDQESDSLTAEPDSSLDDGTGPSDRGWESAPATPDSEDFEGEAAEGARERILVEEAPPGYQLNKLRRSEAS